MANLHPPRQSSMLIIFYSISLISTVVSPYTHHLNLHQPNLLIKRQTSPFENSLLNPLSPNSTFPTGSNRASNLNPTQSDPASNSSSTPTLTSTSKDSTPTSKDSSSTSKDSPLIPLLGSSIGIPTPPNNSSSTPATNSTLAPPAGSSPLLSNTTSPTNKSSTTTTPANSASLPSTPPPEQPTSSNHSISSNPPTTNNHSESHSSNNDKSTFGSTTIKILGITGGVVAGLFFLWTVIRKWKFRPSKRFANKLEDYDEHMFEPRPPSFSEKRPNEFTSYPAQQIPIQSASPGYPSPLSERSHTPHNVPRQNLFSQGPLPYPVHRLSNTSVTKPLPIFDSNYRLSLGLGSEISHSYPPSDHPQPKVQ